jgi:hypothetical protein
VARAPGSIAQPAAVLEAGLADQLYHHLGQSLLRVVRALLPVATLYVCKLIIDEVVLLVHAPPAVAGLRQWIASGLLHGFGLLLAIEFGLAVLSDVLGRAVSLLDSLLSAQSAKAPIARVERGRPRAGDRPAGNAHPLQWAMPIIGRTTA